MVCKGKKGVRKSPGSPGTFKKKSRDLWTSLVPGPRDHGTFKVSRSCTARTKGPLRSPGPVPSRPGTFPGLPGTEWSCWKAYPKPVTGHELFLQTGSSANILGFSICLGPRIFQKNLSRAVLTHVQPFEIKQASIIHPARIDLLCKKNWGTQLTIEISSNQSKSWGLLWSCQLNSTDNSAHLVHFCSE